MIITVEASFAGSKCGLLVQLLDFAIEDIEGGAECAWEAVVGGDQRRPIRAKDAQIEFGVEEGDLQAVAGRGIPVRFRNAMDQTLESKASKVVGHLRGRIRTTPGGPPRAGGGRDSESRAVNE